MVKRRMVVHCKREPYDVYIGRPSIWGNPYRLEAMPREEAVRRYEQWIRSQPRLAALARKTLKGKVLGCWCAPQACHGDVLVRIANEKR